jgi:acetolactate synthase-1/2/3 large subunit
MDTSTQLAGHLIVECLIAQGVTHVFGVPGESYLAVLDGFHLYRDQIRFVTNRQEGGAAFMAEAQGKLTGRPGVCFVTRAPGATNASIGVHTAFQDSSPMVLLVGDVASDTRDREAFQEMDYNHFLGPGTKGLAKRVERIDTAERIPEAIARAFATAMAGRPGPVVLVLPEDMLTQSVAVRPLPKVEPVPIGLAPEALTHITRLLLNAKRPFVLAGGAGWTPQAAKDLEHFVHSWQLPVGNAFRFQDTFDNHHACYAGDVGIALNPALAERIRQADVLLVLGPRLGEMTTSGYTLLDMPVPRQTWVHVHSGADELNRVYHTPYAYNASMTCLAAALKTLMPPSDVPWRDWTAQAHQDYLSNRLPQEVSLNPAIAQGAGRVRQMARHTHTLQRLLPADAVLTNGAGNFASWLHRYYQYPGLARGLKTQLAPTNGAMGYGVPAGISAAITSGRLVVTFTGDGDFLMNGQELATAVQHGARSIVILLNNGMYGTIRMHQEREFPGHVCGSALSNPDFCALAQAYGYQGLRVQDDDQFEPALRAALAHPGGTLIELMLEPELITTRVGLSNITEQALLRKA